MKNNLFTFLIIALSAAAGVLGSYFVFRGDDAEESAESVMPGSRVVKTVSRGNVKKVKVYSVVEKPDGKRSVRVVETTQVRPGSSKGSDPTVEDIDEENLTGLQKAVLKELQDALDDNDIRRVRRALSKFVAKADAGGLGGKVPVCLRKRAVEALGWFGRKTAVDLIEYVADASEEVAADAFGKFEAALSDGEMGDVERSRILTAAMTALTDGEQVDTLLNQLNDMRNSVKAQTAGEILKTGSDVAKAKLLEQMEFYFEEGVADADGLDKWQATNPDDSTDAETYGGSEETDQEQ